MKTYEISYGEGCKLFIVNPKETILSIEYEPPDEHKYEETSLTWRWPFFVTKTMVRKERGSFTVNFRGTKYRFLCGVTEVSVDATLRIIEELKDIINDRTSESSSTDKAG